MPSSFHRAIKEGTNGFAFIQGIEFPHVRMEFVKSYTYRAVPYVGTHTTKGIRKAKASWGGRFGNACDTCLSSAAGRSGQGTALLSSP